MGNYVTRKATSAAMGICLTRKTTSQPAVIQKQKLTQHATTTDLGNYVIRNVTSATEICSTHVKAAQSEGWRCTIDDHELQFTTDPSAFFLGELDGKTISCMSAIKYGDEYAFLDYYVVDKLYRGKGYGLALIKHALASLSPTLNLGADAALDMVPQYETFMGLKTTWTNRIMLFDVSHCSSHLDKFNTPTNVLVQPAKQVDLDILSSYDTAAFGAPHHLFLKALLDSPNSINIAATNPRGDIVGFISARRTIIQKEGWNITPLFADDGQIARALLKNIFAELVKELPERSAAMMEIPFDINPEACVLAKELNGRFLCDFNRMFSKGALDIPKEKTFSFT